MKIPNPFYKPRHLKKVKGRNPMRFVIIFCAVFIAMLLIAPVVKDARSAAEIPIFEPTPPITSVIPLDSLDSSVGHLPMAPEESHIPPIRVVEPCEIDLTVETGGLYELDDLICWGQQAELGMQLDEEYATRVIDVVENCWRLMYYECYEGETLVQALAKTVTAEIGGLTNSTAFSTAHMEEAAVVWCVLNRVDDIYVNGDASQVEKVLKKPRQFAYRYSTKIHEGHEALVIDVIIRWQLEKSGLIEDVGRVLPAEYLFFSGDGNHNWFRSEYETCDWRHYWDWSLPDPYILTKA